MCFDAATLKAARSRAGPELPIIQLLSSRTDVTDTLLDDVATYATGIGPSLQLLLRGVDARGRPQLTDLAEAARMRGLLVHSYTFRADDLPEGAESFEALLDVFVGQLAVDGLITDFTDRVARYCAARVSPDPSSAASRGT